MLKTNPVLFALGIAQVIGCGAAGPSSPPGAPNREPASIASSETDRRIGALAPAALTRGETGALDQAIEAHFEVAATRRAYVMTDKPLYQPGETIWFRVDLRATKTLVGGAPTGLMMQLVSPRGAIVSQKRVLVQDGVARNDFALAPEIEGGEYTIQMSSDDGTRDTKKIVVSTYEPPRLQKTLELLRKAYGEGDAVSAAVEVKRATGEPLAERALTAVVTIDDVERERLTVRTDRGGKALVRFTLPGSIARGDGLLTILAEDGGVTESIQKPIPIVLKKLSLAVFPEGGDLVDGVPGRVYFMARTPAGKPADIEGKVVDDRGQAVAELRSVHDGMGRFELVPATDRTYHVEITKPAGIAARFPLPAAKPGGCVIRSVDQRAAGTLRVAAVCNTARRLIVEAVLRERRLASGTFDVEAGAPTLVELPVDPAAQGAARVTLFSTRHEPLAERLVYHGLGADLKITITPDRKSYAPRDRVRLAIKAVDAAGRPVQASLGLAVVDETVLSYADDKGARLLAHLFLEPELGATDADPIHEPNYYFSGKPEAAAAMDALLATRGYRRFEWRPILARTGSNR
ncbi:MAG TPA: MG2 domain-containing protein [Kofleriaceae bacterium]|nr:MG2 domain-containing protein [Kofleriaceae bacterium]